MLKYFLGTNIVIYVTKRRSLGAMETFNQNVERMAISAIALPELHHGAEKVPSSPKT